MKRLIYAPAALASLENIFAWTIEHFGDAQAERYKNQLAARLVAAAAGEPPHPLPCERLLMGKRDATGLTYLREGRHFLVLRERAESLELVEVFHDRMNLEARLRELAGPS